MTITRKLDGDRMTVVLTGRLDTVTSNDLNAEIEAIFTEGAYNLTLDITGVDYISSAGLRVLLIAQKKSAAASKEMEVIGASENVQKVFDMTGFTKILNIR